MKVTLFLFIVAAFALLLFSTPATSQTQADQEQCVPFAKIEAQAAGAPGFTNLRKVDPKYVDMANEIMDEVAPQATHGWTEFYLLNRDDGGGVMFMGHDGLICRFMPFNAAHWFPLLRLLEGTGA